MKVVKTVEEFDAAVQAAKTKAVVVDFFAEWCGPCKMISPRVEEFGKAYPGVVVLKVDVDDSSELAERYEISAMPTFLVLKNGNVVDTLIGADVDKVEELFKRYSTGNKGRLARNKSRTKSMSKTENSSKTEKKDSGHLDSHQTQSHDSTPSRPVISTTPVYSSGTPFKSTDSATKFQPTLTSKSSAVEMEATLTSSNPFLDFSGGLKSSNSSATPMDQTTVDLPASSENSTKPAVFAPKSGLPPKPTTWIKLSSPPKLVSPPKPSVPWLKPSNPPAKSVTPTKPSPTGNRPPTPLGKSSSPKPTEGSTKPSSPAPSSGGGPPKRIESSTKSSAPGPAKFGVAPKTSGTWIKPATSLTKSVNPPLPTAAPWIKPSNNLAGSVTPPKQ